jgi:hypothetical protein
LQIWIGKKELAIKPARPFRDSRVQSVKMVRAANHQDAIIFLQTVDFVEEEGAHAVIDERVEVFEYEVAGRFLASFAENLSKRELGRDETVWYLVVSPILCVAVEIRRYSG